MHDPDPLLPLSPEVKAERSRSFGQVAGQYERYRPGPPQEAVEWLLPAPVDCVVDMGAGTGALTRLLSGHAGNIIAVEPDAQMRAVLEAEVPGVAAREGRAEDIPLPDRSVDAVVASSSWHWVDPVPALREVARVLRPGGFLAALWSGPDRDSAFIAQASEMLREFASGRSGKSDATSETVRAMDSHTAPTISVLDIPDGLPFAEPELHIIRWDMALTVDDLMGMLGTFSWVILMEPEARAELFTTARRLMRDGLGLQGEDTIDLTFRCDVYRSPLIG